MAVQRDKRSDHGKECGLRDNTCTFLSEEIPVLHINHPLGVGVAVVGLMRRAKVDLGAMGLIMKVF